MQVIGLACGKQLGLQMASDWTCWRLGLQMASDWTCWQLGLQVESNWTCRWQAIGLAGNWACRWKAIGLADGKRLDMLAIGLADGKQLGLQMANNWACSAESVQKYSWVSIFPGVHVASPGRELCCTQFSADGEMSTVGPAEESSHYKHNGRKPSVEDYFRGWFLATPYFTPNAT